MRLPATLVLVVRRGFANPAPVAAIAINVLVVCVLVSGLSASLALVLQETLSSRLHAAEVAESVVEVTSPYDADAPGPQDQAVRDALAPVIEVAGGDVVTLAESGTFDLRDDAGGSWTFAAIGGGTVSLDPGSGRLPEPTDGPLEAAAPEGSNLPVGTTVTLIGRSGDQSVEVLITGTWSVPADSERSLSSVDNTSLVIPLQRFDEVAGPGTLARWRAVPDLERLGADELGALSAAVTRAEVEVEAAGETVSAAMQFHTDLTGSLALIARQLTVMRALLLVPAGLLLLVAAAGLVLVAAGLASVRQEDESLLRSRGAGQRQLVAPTVVESLLVCGLAALLAPPAATLVVRIGDTRPDLGPPAWWASAGAAGVCALALTVPVVVRAVTGDRGEQQNLERQRRRALTGLLATVLLVAGLGLLAVATLRRFGETVAGASVESTRVDLLSVASPALLLLAVAVVVALVLLPVWFRLLAAGLASRGPGPSLGSRFAARAPTVAIPLALTVTLAAGVLTFAAVERTSSAAARVARADFVAAADARVIPPASAVRAGEDVERRLLATTSGVRRVTPVHRSDTFVEGLPTQTLMAELSSETAVDLLGPDNGSWEGLIDRPGSADGRDGASGPTSIPAAVTTGLADGVALAVGDTLRVAVLGIPASIEIVAIVPAVRSVADGNEAILVDTDTALATLRSAGFNDQPSEWWLDLDDGSAPAVVSLPTDQPSVADDVITPAGSCAPSTTTRAPAAPPSGRCCC